jgi:RNA polymerase sigma-70 factor (ECF subfamily)
MISEDILIEGCRNFNRSAQRELYSMFSAKMRGVCLRYVSNKDEAKDIMQEGFIKVFSNVSKFSGNGSLEGWIRRIMVNTALSHYNKQKKRIHSNLEDIKDESNFVEEENVEEDELNGIAHAELSQEELLNSLNILTEPFRLVFNLYYLEEYSHREIAGILSIDEKTSRTRLFRGRKILQKYLNSLCEKKIKAKVHQA